MLSSKLDPHGFRAFTISRDRVYAFVAGFLMASIWTACAGVAQAQAPTQAPTLPRLLSTAMPAVSGAVRRVPAGGDLQAALDSAHAGDAIELACGATYPGSFRLSDKGPSTAVTVIRSSCGLPPEGTRMTPAIAVALHLPVVQARQGPAFFTVPGAHHWRIVGIEIAPADSTGLNVLVAFGSDAGQTVLSTVPHDLVLDRSYVHGFPGVTLRRGVALNSASSAVLDSWISECHEAGADSQAIMGWNGPGPYKIVGNYLEGAAENVMFGGSDPESADLIPSDIEFRRNYVRKPLAWQGSQWLVKNLFELKNARRVLVEGNVFENSWAAGQDGSAIVLKSTDQYGSCPTCGTSHVTFRLNVVRNVGGAFNLAAHPESAPVDPMHDVAITDNVVANVRTATFSGPGQGWFVQANIAGLTIAHNTVVNRTAIGVVVLMPFGTPLMDRLRFTDNLSTSAESNYGLYGDNTGPGLATIAAYAPTAVMTGNLWGGMNQGSLDGYATRYPTGNRFAATTGGLGFVDSTVVERLDSLPIAALLAAVRLRAGSAFAGTASGGKDPGADIDAVLAATAGVADGVAGPAPIPAPPPTPTPAPVPVPAPVLPAGGCWRTAMRALPACVSDATALSLVHSGGALWRATPTGVVVLLAAGDSVTLRAEVVRTTLFVAPANAPTTIAHVDTVVHGDSLGRRTLTLSLGGRTGHADVLVVP